MTRTTILIILGLMIVWLPAAARAQDGAGKAETAKPTAAAEVIESKKQTESAKQAEQVAPAPTVPRRDRWGPMKAEYLMANTTHPPLVFDSEQEKLRHDDARLRNLPGVLASGMYEVLRFPASMALCPVYLVTKPVWVRERAEP